MSHYQHRLYVTWKQMRQRCLNPKATSYKSHGSRGITITPEWDDFSKFLEDMYPSFKEGLSLDRIDNNGPYSKENCRWADRKTQSRNTTRTKFIEYNGQSKILADWSKELGIKRSTLAQRLYVYKWPISKTLSI